MGEAVEKASDGIGATVEKWENDVKEILRREGESALTYSNWNGGLKEELWAVERNVTGKGNGNKNISVHVKEGTIIDVVCVKVYEEKNVRYRKVITKGEGEMKW